MPQTDKDQKNQNVDTWEEEFHKEAIALEAERMRRRQAQKEKEAADEHTRSQITTLQWWANLIKTVTFRIGSLIKNIFKVAGHGVEALGTVIPPINALFTGIFYIFDMIEAIFLSKETRDLRAVKGVTASMSTGLVIASAAMLLHPVTFPLASAFSTAAMLVSTVREGYFWYKAGKAIDTKKQEVASAKKEYEDTKIEYDYAKLQHEKGALSDQEMYHYTETFNSSISHYNQKTEEAAALEATRKEKKRSFLFSALSFVGMALITLAAVAVAGLIIVNPIALAVVGVVALGIATACAIKNRISPPQAEPVMKIEKMPVKEVDTESPTSKVTDQEEIKPKPALQESSEAVIALDLARNKEDAKHLLEEDVKSLHELSESAPVKSKDPLPASGMPDNVIQFERKKEEDESEGSKMKGLSQGKH